MRIRRWIGGLAGLLDLAVLGVLYFYTGSAWVLTAAVLLPVAELLSLLWNLAARRSLRLSIFLPSGSGKGEAVCGRAEVVGGSFLPLGRVWCELHVQNDLTGEAGALFLPMEQNGNGVSRSFCVNTRHCGRVTGSVKRLVLTGFFGILSVSCPVDAHASMTVMPDMFTAALPGEAACAIRPESESTRDDRRGTDLTEIFQIRDYLPGDDPRGIHYKLSSKLDKLLYREPGAPTDRSILLCWDQYTGTPEELDALAEATFSVGQSFCEAGYPYSLGWNEQGELGCAEVATQDDLLLNLPSLLRRRAAAPLLPEQLAGFGTVILFTARPPEAVLPEGMRIFCFGGTDGSTVITTENYKEVLQSAELWL